MIRGYKIRLYPNKEQEQKFKKHIGASRWIWNYMLNLQQERFKNGEKYLSEFDMNRLITKLRQEYVWLQDISSATLYRRCADLNRSYQRAFQKINNFPTFKTKKHSKMSFPLRDQRGRVWFSEKFVTIPNVGKVKYKTDFNMPLGNNIKFLNPRISYVNNKWILSINLECENQTYKLTDKLIGVDLGVKKTATVAYDDQIMVFNNINKSKKMKKIEKQIKHLQRSIFRKYELNRDGLIYKKTKNIIKEEEKLRKLYAKQKNIRNNYIHQMTHKIVSLNPCQIVVEDLNVLGLMKNRHLSKVIQEQCFYEIIRQIKYKSEWHGIKFIKANRFFASSKICSNCGNIKHDLTLKDRVFECRICGLKIDRDENAAINLMKYTIN